MELTEKYAYLPSDEAINSGIQAIASNLDNLMTDEVLKQCFAAMDLTTLKTQDTEKSVLKLVNKANALKTEFPQFPLPASICVYPNFAATVRAARESEDLHVTTVAGCFPSSQSFIEVKVDECRRAVASGADEVDIVLPLNSFLAGDYDAASSEIRAMREAVDAEGKVQGRKVVLKVILETGLLSTPELIAEASFLAMEAGADFIKTSTGKVEINATPVAAYVMCESIKAFYAKTGRKVGFKAAGGISSAKDALCYYLIVSTVLGKEWLGKDLFRLGVSRLGNSLMSAVEQKTVNYF